MNRNIYFIRHGTTIHNILYKKLGYKPILNLKIHLFM